MIYIPHAIAVVAALTIFTGILAGERITAKAKRGRNLGILILLLYGAWLLSGAPNFAR